MDFKTSNYVHDTYAMQLAAYVNAYREVFGNDPEIADAVVVRFDKRSGAFEEKRVGDLDAAFSAFKAALYLWKTTKQPLFVTSRSESAALETKV